MLFSIARLCAIGQCTMSVSLKKEEKHAVGDPDRVGPTLNSVVELSRGRAVNSRPSAIMSAPDTGLLSSLIIAN